MDAFKILHTFPDGLAVFDRALNTLFVNPSLRETLKVSGSGNETTANDIFALNPQITERLNEFLRGGISHLDHDFVLLTTGGEKIPVELSISNIDYGKTEGGAVVIVRQIHGKDELSTEFEKDEKMAMLSMMAAGLAHEIKNPLGGIRGAAQLIGLNNPALSEYSEIIVRETDRVSGLVNELLNLRGERKPHWIVVNIHQPIDETIALMGPLIKDRKADVIRDYDPSLPDFKAEPDRLKQVFINLCKNALESMPKGGTLRIKTRAALTPTAARSKGRSAMTIEFVDDGKGVSEKVSRNLFTPFNTSKKQGTGLGLIMSLKIVRDHGGTLDLENNANGKGATARVTIPIER